jgi:hypothetical protein
VIDGRVEQKPDGSTWQIFSLEEAASQRPIDPEHPRVVAHLVVETRKDGTLHHFVRAGELNRATHELDASGVTLLRDSAKGKMRVIFHADPWTAPNPETGGPLVADYEIDAKISGEKITGTHTGTLGVGYEATHSATADYLVSEDVR